MYISKKAPALLKRIQFNDGLPIGLTSSPESIDDIVSALYDSNSQ